MTIHSCHGDIAKRKLLAKYEIKPKLHTRILNGQRIQGCCGPITDIYYLFEAKDRDTKKISDFYVGYDCAGQLLTLANLTDIVMFDPFKSSQDLTNKSSTNSTKQQKALIIHPLNEELRNSIYLLCSAWGGKAPRGKLRNTIEYIEKMPQRPTDFFAIKEFNRIIEKDAKKRSLTQIINDMRFQNPNLRTFSFPLMEKALKDNGIKSNI